MQTFAVDATGLASQPRTERGMDALRSEDFFRLLVTELQNQDPLKPSETADMIGQVSDIRNIEISNELTDVLTQMTQQQHTAGASELLGRFVTATMVASDGTAYQTAGVVTGVRFDPNGTAVLELDTGESVLAAAVTHVMSAETAETLAATQSDAVEDDADAAASAKSDGTAKARADGPLSWVANLLNL